MRTRLRKAVAGEILAAAEAVMAERGVHAASMGEIAARAGVSVGTLYNHFADRKALVQALYRLRREQLSPRLLEILRAHTGAAFAARLRLFIRDVLRIFEEHRSFIKVASEGEQMRPQEARGPGGTRPVMVRLLDCFAELLQAGAAEGEVGPGDHDLAARFAVAAIKAVAQRALETGEPFSDEAEAAAHLILHGVLRGS